MICAMNYSTCTRWAGQVSEQRSTVRAANDIFARVFVIIQKNNPRMLILPHPHSCWGWADDVTPIFGSAPGLVPVNIRLTFQKPDERPSTARRRDDDVFRVHHHAICCQALSAPEISIGAASTSWLGQGASEQRRRTPPHQKIKSVSLRTKHVNNVLL